MTPRAPGSAAPDEAETRPRLPARVTFLLASAVALFARDSAAQTVREKVEVQVVTLRVTARSRSGKPVEDLKLEDLALSVDDRRVPIETLFLAKSPSASDQQRTVSDAAPLTAPAVVPSAPAIPDRPIGPDRLIAIVIDEGGTKTFDRRAVFDQLAKFLEASRGGSVRTLVARFDGSRLVIESPWSTDAQGALSALSRMRANPTIEKIPTVSELNGSDTSQEEISANRRRLCRALLEALSLFPKEGISRELVFASGGAVFAHPADIADYLGQAENANRAGLPWGPARSGYFAKGQPERDTSAFAVWSRNVMPGYDGVSMADVESKAVELDIALVPIAAEPVDRDRSTMPTGFAEKVVVDLKSDSALLPGSGDLASSVPPLGASGKLLKPSYRLGVAQALSAVAANTGGEPILAPGNTADRLAEIGNRAVYELTFRDPLATDPRVHQIALTCAKSGVTLEYRKGYRIETRDERILDEVVARLVDRDRPPDPTFSANLSGASLNGKRVTHVTLRFQPPQESSPAEQRGLAFVAVGEHASGQRTAPVRWTAEAQRDASGRLETTEDFGVPNGSLVWSIAVTDLSTGLTAFAIATPE